jgi:hypothetical protein
LLLFFLLWLLFPLAFYCLVLGTINRRAQPLLVAGTWDFVGLLCALSGFLLIDGPWLIGLSYDRAEKTIFQRDIENAAKDAPQMDSDVKDERKSVQEQVASAQETWAWIWVLYFVVVVAGAALLVWARRNVAVVYNIDPPTFQDVLTRSLERLGMSWHLDGRRLVLRPGGPDAGGVATIPSEQAECHVDAFPLMYHVTMHWRRDPMRLRPRVEQELALQIRGVQTFDNPTAAWFLIFASCLFGLVLMGVVIVMLGTFLPRWR